MHSSSLVTRMKDSRSGSCPPSPALPGYFGQGPLPLVGRGCGVIFIRHADREPVAMRQLNHPQAVRTI